MSAGHAQRERDAKLKAEEQQERNAMLARAAEQERLDQLSAWQRKIRRAEHAKEVEGLLAVKKGLQQAALVGLDAWNTMWSTQLNPAAIM